MPEFRLHERNGHFWWVTVAENGEILSTSETYTRIESAQQGARAAGYEGEPLKVEDEGGNDGP